MWRIEDDGELACATSLLRFPHLLCTYASMAAFSLGSRLPWEGMLLSIFMLIIAASCPLQASGCIQLLVQHTVFVDPTSLPQCAGVVVAAGVTPLCMLSLGIVLGMLLYLVDQPHIIPFMCRYFGPPTSHCCL